MALQTDEAELARKAKFKKIMGISALVCLLLAALVLTFGTAFGLERGMVLLIGGALFLTAGMDYVLMKYADKIVATGRKKP